MYRYNIYIAFVFLCILSLFSLSTKANPIYVTHYCGNTTSYTQNSTYEANLNTLLSSLSSNATNEVNFEIQSTTFGRDPPNIAYGYYLCLGDMTAADCPQCLAIASARIVELCPRNKMAFIWYSLCMMRFSNQSSFSTLEESHNVVGLNPQNMTDQTGFKNFLADQMNGLAIRATVADRFGRKFATNETRFTRFDTLYSLVQCMPYLTEIDCNRCLRDSIDQLPSCCDGRRGATILNPSCNLRYETFPFYRVTATDPPPTTVAPTPPPHLLPPPSDVASPREQDNNRTRTVITVVVPSVIFLTLIVCIFIFLIKRRQRKSKGKFNSLDEISSVESLQYEFGVLRAATDSFSDTNKLGKGGFGVVYKGRLLNGQEIAVKRLSMDSRQGETAFKNEVLLMSKLQHRNLVRLLGFCCEGTERLLIYEFMPNGSLDHFIFDPIKRADLNWHKRYKIIEGIARGLLYLHEDSRLRIVHRDLKPSNVLLGGEMNPKIADFGMAKLFVPDETQGDTNSIVGTYGYMAPEYAMHGKFSVKSDVFSFGVLVLEIVSGQKTNSFRIGEALNLLNFAWENWEKGMVQNMIDPTLEDDSGLVQEIMGCIHVGMLCIQENVDKRPTMASVVQMLKSFSTTLPLPLPSHSPLPSPSPLENSFLACFSVDEASITKLFPR